MSVKNQMSVYTLRHEHLCGVATKQREAAECQCASGEVCDLLQANGRSFGRRSTSRLCRPCAATSSATTRPARRAAFRWVPAAAALQRNPLHRISQSVVHCTLASGSITECAPAATPVQTQQRQTLRRHKLVLR